MRKDKIWNYRKILLTCLGLLLINQICIAQIDGEVSLEFASEEKAMESAKETVVAYETGNWDLLTENVTPEVTFYNLGSHDSLSLDETIQYWKKGREVAIPVLADDGAWLAVSVPKGPRKGNWILHWGNNTLTYPNGETISFPYHVALKLENEKVSQAHFYYDNNRIIRALGYEIQPPLEEGVDDDLIDDNQNKP